MKRHLIIEGCDGTGKDTLIRQLRLDMPEYMLHDRASHSINGPVAGLDEWVEADNMVLHRIGPHIYNRHPLISEPIYGPHREGRPTHPAFRDKTWLDLHRSLTAAFSILIIVQPPWSVVNDILITQGPHEHMAGVYENRRYIYEQYRAFTWPGIMLRYNRTATKQGDFVLQVKRLLADQDNQDRNK